MTDRYPTPPDPDLPSIFDVQDGDMQRDEYAIPGTRFELYRVGPWAPYEVRRDGERDEAATLALRRFDGWATNAETMREIGHMLLDIAREEARGLRLAGVSAGGQSVCTDPIVEALRVAYQQMVDAIASDVEMPAPLVSFKVPPAVNAELSRMAAEAFGEEEDLDPEEAQPYPTPQRDPVVQITCGKDRLHAVVDQTGPRMSDEVRAELVANLRKEMGDRGLVGLCRDCKHWEPFRPEYKPRRPPGPDDVRGFCRAESMKVDCEPRGELCTAPTFGCVLFERRGAAPDKP